MNEREHGWKNLDEIKGSGGPKSEHEMKVLSGSNIDWSK